MQCNPKPKPRSCPKTAHWTLVLLTCWGLAGCRAIAGYEAASLSGDPIPGGGIAGTRLPGLLHVFTIERYVGGPVPNVQVWVDDGATLQTVSTDADGHVAVAVRAKTVNVHALIELVSTKSNLSAIHSVFGVAGSELTLPVTGPTSRPVPQQIEATVSGVSPSSGYAGVSALRDLPLVNSKRNFVAEVFDSTNFSRIDSTRFKGWVVGGEPFTLSCGYVDTTNIPHRLIAFGLGAQNATDCPLTKIDGDFVDLNSTPFDAWTTVYGAAAILRPDGEFILTPHVLLQDSGRRFYLPPLDRNGGEEHKLVLAASDVAPNATATASAYCLAPVAAGTQTDACALPPPPMAVNFTVPGRVSLPSVQGDPPGLVSASISETSLSGEGPILRWAATVLRPTPSELTLPSDVRQALSGHLGPGALSSSLSLVYLDPPADPAALQIDALHGVLLGIATTRGVPFDGWFSPDSP